eukprot:11864789-Alexandrium_andersonii.AAC.1
MCADKDKVARYKGRVLPASVESFGRLSEGFKRLLEGLAARAGRGGGAAASARMGCWQGGALRG